MGEVAVGQEPQVKLNSSRSGGPQSVGGRGSPSCRDPRALPSLSLPPSKGVGPTPATLVERFYYMFPFSPTAAALH